jgi:hypothetical protein
MPVLVAALTALAVVAGLATSWPWDLVALAGVLAGLVIIARLGHRSLVDELVLAGFVGGVLLLIVSYLATSVFYVPDWLPAGAGLGLRLAVLALGLAAVALPTGSHIDSRP